MINQQPININITAASILKIIFLLVLFYFLFLIKEVLYIILIAIILASALNPSVNWLQSKKIPRAVSVILIYLFIIFIIGGALYLIIPTINTQIQDLAESYPEISSKITNKYFDIKNQIKVKSINELNEFLANPNELIGELGGFFALASDIFGGFFAFMAGAVLIFYILVSENALQKFIWPLIPDQHQVHAIKLINKIQHKVGLWLRGQLILSLIIFILVFIGLNLLNYFTFIDIKFILLLAVIAAIAEFIPFFGPIFAAIPAVFIAFSQTLPQGNAPALLAAIIVALLYYILQFLEGHIIVPNLMRRVVGLNPIICIVVLLIGFKLGGVIGAIIAIPVTTAISVIIKDYYKTKTIAKNNAQ